MAYFGFTDKHFSGEPIKIFNNGDFENDLYCDFTYIDDIVVGIERLITYPPVDTVPHKVYNIGNNSPEKLMTFIQTLEKALSNSLGREFSLRKSLNQSNQEMYQQHMHRQIDCKRHGDGSYVSKIGSLLQILKTGEERNRSAMASKFSFIS